jgi:hypothetical protein
MAGARVTTSTPLLPPELLAAATEAWGMLARDSEPMPVGIVLDWLRGRMDDTDDVGECKRGLYHAAAGWVHETYIANHTLWNSTPSEVEVRIRQGEFELRGAGGFISPIDEIRRVAALESFAHERDAAAWLPWCDRADTALALCREIQAAGEQPT